MNECVPPLMRHAAVLTWLCRYGFAKRAIRTWITRGIICGKTLRPGGRAWYSPRQIWKDVLRKLGSKEEIQIAYPKDPPAFKPFGKADLIPYGIMRDWLGHWGLTGCEVRALVETGRIRPIAPIKGWKMFSVTQIKRDVLDVLLK
jgi:hypothetical protein